MPRIWASSVKVLFSNCSALPEPPLAVAAWPIICCKLPRWKRRYCVRKPSANSGEERTFEKKWQRLASLSFSNRGTVTFDEWLNSPRLSFARPLPALAAVTSALLAGIVVAGLLGIISWASVATWIFPLVAFHIRGRPFLPQPRESNGGVAAPRLQRNARVAGGPPASRSRTIPIGKTAAALRTGAEWLSIHPKTGTVARCARTSEIRIGSRSFARASGRHAIVHGRSSAGEESMANRSTSVAASVGGIRGVERAGRLRLRKSREYVSRADGDTGLLPGAASWAIRCCRKLPAS